MKICSILSQKIISLVKQGSKNQEVLKYFPTASKTGDFFVNKNPATIISQNFWTIKLQDCFGILKLKNSQFKARFKAVQNLYKNSILLNELDGKVCHADVMFGHYKLKKNGKLYTGKVIYAPNNQVDTVTKIEKGIPVSSLKYRAGILPATYSVYNKSNNHIEPQIVKKFNVEKFYKKLFPQMLFKG